MAAAHKQLYGWGTINANVWLPSLSELVGYNPDTYNDMRGCYASAMQDIPPVTPGNDNVDKKGGEQWAWLVPFNPSGGAAEIWRLCGSTRSWLRSTDKAQSQHVWAVTSQTMISWAQLVTDSNAVHPAVSSEQIPYLSLIPKGQGKSSLTSLLLLRRYKFHISRFRLRRKLAHSTVPPLHKKARLLRLLACKRAPNASAALPPFCGRRAY